MKRPLEYCCTCGEETGRAGRGEDSIYPTLAKDWYWRIGNEKRNQEQVTEAGNEIGPLCEECYGRMRDDGMFEE